MAFEGLSEKLQGAFKKLTGRGKQNEQMVKGSPSGSAHGLLEADVNYGGQGLY
jgi:signal recognition particle subunit SRP54